MPPFKATKTYEKKAKNPMKGFTKSEDAINALFAQNLSKRLIGRKKKKKPRIEIKELPARTGAYNMTDDSLKVSADDTFDKVLKGQVFNKVKVVKNFVAVNTSESDSSKSKLAQVNVSFHSPIMTRKRRKQKNVIISDIDPNSSNRALVDYKNTTLDKPVTDSLCIEKINNKPVNASSLSYIHLQTITENKILPQEHLNISKMESSYEPMFSDTFREKHAVISSTPCVRALPKIATTDSISPISKSSSNSSKLIEKSYDVIHKWDSTFPASIEGDTPKGPVLRSANRYVGAPAKRVRKRKLTVTRNNVAHDDWKLATSPKVYIKISEIIDFKTVDPKLRVDPKVFLTNCFEDSIQTDESKNHSACNLSQDFKGFDETEKSEAEKHQDYICNELRIRGGDEITENNIVSGPIGHQRVDVDTTDSSIVTNSENVVKELRFVTIRERKCVKKRRGRKKKKIIDDDTHLDQELSAVASQIEAILDKSDQNFSPEISEFFDVKQTNDVKKRGRPPKKRRELNKKIISTVDPSLTSEIESSLYNNTTNNTSSISKQSTLDSSAEDLSNNVLDRLNSDDKQKRVQKDYILKRHSKNIAIFTKSLPLGRKRRTFRKTLVVNLSDFDSFERTYLSGGKPYKEIKSELIDNKVDTSIISVSSGMDESFSNDATTSKVIVEKVNQSPKNYPRIYSTDDVKNGVEVVLPRIERRTSFKTSPRLRPFHTTVNFSPKQPSLKFSPVKDNVSPGNVSKFSTKTTDPVDSSITSDQQVLNASRCLDFSASPQRKTVKIIRKKPKIVVLSDIQLGRPVPLTPLDRVKATCKDVWHDHSYSNSPMVNLKYVHSTPKSSERKMGHKSFNSNLSKVKFSDAKYLDEDVGSSVQNASQITTQSKSSSSNLSKARRSSQQHSPKNTSLVQRASVNATEQNRNSKSTLSIEKRILEDKKVIQIQKSSSESNSSGVKPSIQLHLNKDTKNLLQTSPHLIKQKTGSNPNLDKSTKTILMKHNDVYDSDFSDVVESSLPGASVYARSSVQSAPVALKKNSKTNVSVQKYSPPKVIRKSIQNAVTQTEQSRAFISSNLPSVIESPVHLKDSTKSAKLKAITLRPGKSYRRSLSVLRKSSVFDEMMSVKCPENCICPTCLLKIKLQTNTRRSSLMVSFIPQQISVRPSLLQEYIHNLSYVQEELNKSNLDDSFRDLSINSNNSGFRQSRAQAQVTAKDVVLRKCGQTDILGFQECYPNSLLQNCQKIGEGLYGEVFLRRNPKGGTSVMKIIPIEGDLIVNGEKQKKIEEIVSEIEIATGLSDLRFNKKNCTSNFSEVQSVRCVQGRYPERLIELWELYDESKGSENDSPQMFQDDQQFIVLELANGGKDLESYIFNNAQQVFAIFKQTACALAVAESQLKFEHRDLHWGNILINTVEKEKTIHFRLNGKEITVETYGTEAAIIDFTLSRVEIDGIVFFNDLSLDPNLFVGKGDYQFEIYRLMQQNNGNDWQRFEPYSNILWLHYILDKAVTSALRYKNIRSKIHNEYMTSLKKIKAAILSYNSVVDFVNDNFV